MKQVVPNKSTLDVKGVVSRENGGTSATSPTRAASNLGMLLAKRSEDPEGPIPLDSNGLIPLEYLAGVASYRAECDGPETVQAGNPSNYRITNFDARIIYNLSTDNGSVVLSGDTIIYTPGADRDVQPGFTLNAERWNLSYRPNVPLTPNFVGKDLNDVKMFTSRVGRGKMSLAATSDFVRLYVGDSSAEVGGVQAIGQIEGFSVVDNKLTRFESVVPSAPSFDIKAITGASAGSFSATTDAPGWSNAQPTVIPAGSTMLEISVLGGDPWTRLYGSSSITGAEVAPVTLEIGNSLHLEVRTDRRYTAGTYQVQCVKIDSSNPASVLIEEVEATLEVTSGAVTAKITFGGVVKDVPAVWTPNTQTSVDVPGTNSYAMMGYDTIISRGGEQGGAVPVATVRQVKTQKGMGLGPTLINIRNATNRTISGVTGASTAMGVSNYLMINDNGTLRYSWNPSGKFKDTGFGCSLAASDDGSRIIVGENKRNAVRFGKLVGNDFTYDQELFGPEVDSGFGHSVDMNYDGSLFVIGAPTKSMIYVGVMSNGVPSIVASINNPSPTLLGFGEKVILDRSGNRIFTSVRTATGQGEVIVLGKRNNDWVLDGRISAPAGTVDFGKTFSISDDGHVGVVGAPGDEFNRGKVFVIYEGELGWEVSHELVNPESVSKTFGTEVLISRDGLTAAALDPDIASTSTTFGKLYLFG